MASPRRESHSSLSINASSNFSVIWRILSSLICFSSVNTACSISAGGTISLIASNSSSGIAQLSYSCFGFPHSATIVSKKAMTFWFNSCAAKIASIMRSSGTSFAPASIIITFSFVEATVSARSETSLWAAVGLNTNSPSMSPTCVVDIGPSNGISEILVAREAPSIAVSSGLQSWSTDITRFSKVTSFR